MSKRKPKTATTDNLESKPKGKVTVEVVCENQEAVNMMDEFFILPTVTLLGFMSMMAYLNPAFFTAAYWQWLVDNAPAFTWYDILPF
jgi:hypothetical protein